MYMYHRRAQADLISSNFGDISKTSIKDWWKGDFRYGQKLFFTVVDPGPLQSLSMVIGRRGRRRQQAYVPSTSKVVIQTIRIRRATCIICILGGSSWKLPWKLTWKLPWKLPWKSCIKAMKASMKVRKLPWNLPRIYAVGASVEVRSTEASTKASTEAHLHGIFHESNFHGSFHGSNSNGYFHESFHGSNCHTLPWNLSRKKPPRKQLSRKLPWKLSRK